MLPPLGLGFGVQNAKVVIVCQASPKRSNIAKAKSVGNVTIPAQLLIQLSLTPREK
jgi:hypothetical protein